MRNILFVKESTGTYRGGIEGKILSLAGEIIKSDKIRPVLLTSDINSLFSDEFRELGLEVYAMDMDHLLAFRYILRTIDRIAGKHDIGIIQSHAFRESLIARIYRKRRQGIHNVSRVHTHIRGSTIHPLRQKLYYLLDRCTSRWVDHFIVISELLKQELTDVTGIRADKISVVYNGIPPMGPPDEITGGTNPPEHAFAVIGEVEHRKQQHLAVEALKQLRAEGLSLRLHLIGRGEGKYYQDLQLLVRRYGLEEHVIFHGQVKPQGIYRLIRNVPVIALPSLNEGIPTSIIEAMSLRKIVVTTPVGATRELVRHGINGFLHEPGDLSGLTSILSGIYKGSIIELNAVRAEGYRTYLEKFTLETMMAGFHKIYRCLDPINRGL